MQLHYCPALVQYESTGGPVWDLFFILCTVLQLLLTLVVPLCNYIILTIAVAFQEMLCEEYVVRFISQHTLRKSQVVV